MRITLLLLLFANLAFLAWSQWIDVPASSVRGDGSSRLPPLALAGETMESDADPEPEPRSRERGMPVGRCVSVGPFDDEGGAIRGAELLRKKGFGARPRPEPAAGPEGYWVYIPGLASDAAAAQGVRRLAERGFRDASALQPSTGERRINIGFFMDSAPANQRQREVRKLGLKADIALRRLPGMLYWVDVAVRTGDGVLPAQDIYRGPSLKIGARPCPEGGRPSALTMTMAEVRAKPL